MTRSIAAYAFRATLVLAVLMVIGAIIYTLRTLATPRADPGNATQVALGRDVYAP